MMFLDVEPSKPLWSCYVHSAEHLTDVEAIAGELSQLFPSGVFSTGKQVSRAIVKKMSNYLFIFWGNLLKGVLSYLILSYRIINKIGVYKLFRNSGKCSSHFPRAQGCFFCPTNSPKKSLYSKTVWKPVSNFKVKEDKIHPTSLPHIYITELNLYTLKKEEGSVPKRISIYHYWCILSSTLKFEMCWPFIFFGIHSSDFGLSTPLRISLLKHNLPLYFTLQNLTFKNLEPANVWQFYLIVIK